MQQILNQSERTQPTADKPPHKSADKEQKADDIKGKFVIHMPRHRLKGADGTGSPSAGTGITIHAGHAEFFHLSAINFSRLESLNVGIRRQGPKSLKSVALIFTDRSFFLIQCRYTPYIFLRPYLKLPAFPLAKCRKPSSRGIRGATTPSLPSVYFPSSFYFTFFNSFSTTSLH